MDPGGKGPEIGSLTFMEKRWYIVHTYSGYENKVKANLEKRVESMEMHDRIFQMVVPVEEELEIKNGKKKMVKKKIYPGYVLVEMIMTDESWYVVRNTPGVTGFIGSANKPIPLEEAEIRAILGAPSGSHAGEEPQPRIDVAVGDTVRVTTGPFENFVGRVEEVMADKHKLRVRLTMFGRETPVEMDFSEIEKA